MKRLLSIVLALVLMLSYTMSAFATGSTVKQSNVTIQNGFKFEILKDSNKHQKIKITNIETDEVEYLESILENDKYVYLSTSKEGSIRIESDDSAIKMTNQDTKEVKYSKIKTTQSSKEEAVNLSAAALSEANWVWYKTYYRSSNIDTAQLSLAIGIVAAVANVSVLHSIAIAVGTYYYSVAAEEFWYILHTYRDQNMLDHWLHETYYYAYPDYTNYRGMISEEWYYVY